MGTSVITECTSDRDGGTRSHSFSPTTLTDHENDRITSACSGVVVPFTPA
jgi:hypothetical protein